MRLSLHKECRSRAKQALGALGTGGARDPREEMKLHAALGTSTAGGSRDGRGVHEGARTCGGRRRCRVPARALSEASFFSHREQSTPCSRCRKVSMIWQRLGQIGRSAIRRAHHGLGQHFLGDQISARRHLRRALITDTATDHGRIVIRFQIDLQMSTLAFLARVQWLQGFLDQAVRSAEMSIERAQATGNALSQCYALALAACPIALWVGNLAGRAALCGTVLPTSRQSTACRLERVGWPFRESCRIQGGGPAQDRACCKQAPDEDRRARSFQTIMGVD